MKSRAEGDVNASALDSVALRLFPAPRRPGGVSKAKGASVHKFDVDIISAANRAVHMYHSFCLRAPLPVLPRAVLILLPLHPLSSNLVQRRLEFDDKFDKQD